MSAYQRWRFELPSDQEELFSVELWSRGALGIETDAGFGGARAAPDVARRESGLVRLTAWFEDPPPAGLPHRSSAWRGRGIRRLGSDRVVEEDWLAVYRERSRPLEIGRRLLVDPREPGELVDAGDRLLLRVPARRAFGTGSHESTRLVLEWLEDLDLRHRRVLDLGCGSGILSLAALRLGARSCVGLDVDPVAVFVARETARLNDQRFTLLAGDLGCLRGPGFDLALVNVLPSEWIDGADGLSGLLAAGGCAILSGIPEAAADAVAARMVGLGWREAERRAEGEWVALRLEREAA